MSILNFIRGLFKSRDEPQNRYNFSGFPFLFGRSISGKTVNETTALRISAVFACCKILAESVACLPLHVYQQDGRNRTLAVDHPLYFLLHDSPNKEMTAYTFKETLMLHLLTNGNTYSQILLGNRGEIRGLYPLQANRMTVKRNDSGKLIYTYRPTTGENEHMKNPDEVTFQREDILHIPALGFDGLIGYSPIAMARNAIGVAIATEEFGAKFFEQGARPSGILSHPSIIKDFNKLREEWQKIYGGSSNTGKVAILEEGMKYESIAIPPNDAQFLETRKFQIAEIARIFRVPLHMLNELDRATFSNITQQSLEFVVYTLTPWLVRLEQGFNKALFTENERGKFFVKFNVDGLMRGDYQSRMQGYSIGRQNGWLSANDIREMEDMNPISDADGGNYYLVNGNFTKLKDAGAAYEKAGDSNE
ncbi:MAG: phage portal protein [Selenomonadaceae bacterium]|nr:phage portal protein [Selenomonadaceae bacterium]